MTGKHMLPIFLNVRVAHTASNCHVACGSRFTKDSVIVTAPSKVKSGCDLQLPSMATLTSKTSSQAFFLRILKVIVQIRESVRLAHRRNRENSGKCPFDS